jgi:3',5'-nucleoside bisphosphate phosphatase
MIADLHCHSTVSDGAFTPTDVVKLAKKNKVDLLALTDHDMIDGISEAKAQAVKSKMHFLSGVEISVQWKSYKIHMVGLGFDHKDTTLQHGLSEIIKNRQKRAAKIAEKIEKLGCKNVLEQVQKLAGNKNISRVHFALFLIQENKCHSINEAFDKFLGEGKRCYVGLSSINLPTAIMWIKNSGGKTVIAHPLRYKMTKTKLRELCADFKSMKGDGIEVISGRMNENEIRKTTNLCLDFNFKASIGSDFHNDKNNIIYLGMNKELPKKLNPIYCDML